ncbi:unnamed protein product, partial [Mesorhabditis spiculigera]
MNAKALTWAACLASTGVLLTCLAFAGFLYRDLSNFREEAVRDLAEFKVYSDEAWSGMHRGPSEAEGHTKKHGFVEVRTASAASSPATAPAARPDPLVKPDTPVRMAILDSPEMTVMPLDLELGMNPLVAAKLAPLAHPDRQDPMDHQDLLDPMEMMDNLEDKAMEALDPAHLAHLEMPANLDSLDNPDSLVDPVNPARNTSANLANLEVVARLDLLVSPDLPETPLSLAHQDLPARKDRPNILQLYILFIVTLLFVKDTFPIPEYYEPRPYPIDDDVDEEAIPS